MKEFVLGRVINPNSAGKERNQLTKTVVLAIRELFSQSSPDARTKDLVAYLVIALDMIASSVDISVAPWEKRGYWVKADRFRMEWSWAADLRPKLYNALVNEKWDEIASIAILITEKLHKVKIPARHRMGEPWIGAWRELEKLS